MGIGYRLLHHLISLSSHPPKGSRFELSFSDTVARQRFVYDQGTYPVVLSLCCLNPARRGHILILLPRS